MAAVEDLCNTALSALGTKQSITSIAETSVEAQTCNIWYTQVRDMVLAAAPWSSVQAYEKMTLLKERNTAADWVSTDPPPGYLYAYAPPGDMLRPRFLTDYSRFQMTTSNAGVRWLATNTLDPILSYTQLETDITKWDVELRMAVTFALAAHICLKLTGKHERLKILTEEANRKIMTARLNDANSREEIMDTIAPWHAARGTNISSEGRYFFPYGPLVNVGTF